MKLRNPLYCVVCFFLLLQACSGKKDTTFREQPYFDEGKGTEYIDSVCQMRESRVENKVDWDGKTCHCIIERSPSDDADVTDDKKICYKDNTVTLTIKEGDVIFFRRSFTKKDFASCLSNEFLTNGILGGSVFDKVTAEGIRFATSVFVPYEEDLYAPILLTVRKDGTWTIKKDNNLDQDPV